MNIAVGLPLPAATAHLGDYYNYNYININLNDSNNNNDQHLYKWRLVLSYDGTRFSGWQYQSSTPTLQCTLEEALTRVTKLDRKDLSLVGASRTDTGVHALGQQVAHFVTPFNYDQLEDMHAALNGVLPPDVRVKQVSPALPEFHARFSVTGKIYHYKIYNDTVMDPFHRLYTYHNLSKLNICVMKEATKYFVGKHDFSAFANAQRNDRTVNPIKNISRVDIIEKVITFPFVRLYRAPNTKKKMHT